MLTNNMTNRPGQSWGFLLGACRLIYFVSSENFIKIGYSKDRYPAQRLDALQVGNPHPIRLELLIWGDQNDERDLHDRFRRVRHRGEWFRQEQPLLSYMEFYRRQNRKGRTKSRKNIRRAINLIRAGKWQGPLAPRGIMRGKRKLIPRNPNWTYALAR